ncbi:MAG: hypothetical protein IPK22_11400 [Verrucomicrobiaceae bacterium]|nr:hypothetical protein [Verrucomicrobiaceae bacterium]
MNTRQPAQSGSLHPICSADYDRLNFWCQGWLSKLNHVIRLLNHSFNDKQRGRLDVRINHLRARHNAAVKRRQPFADALLKREPNDKADGTAGAETNHKHTDL